MLIFAHRGYGRGACENTLEAFRKAKELGVHGIETDIRLDKDGVPILFHDRRTADGHLVSTLTVADLRTITGVQIPTLEEALAAIDDVIWDLELKESRPTETILKLIKRASKGSRLVVTSFFHQAVVQSMQAAGVDGGFLISHCPTDPLSLFQGVDVSARKPKIIWNVQTMDAEHLKRICEFGGANMIYAFSAPADHGAVPTAFVEGLITDFPNDVSLDPYVQRSRS